MIMKLMLIHKINADTLSLRKPHDNIHETKGNETKPMMNDDHDDDNDAKYVIILM